MHNNSVRITFDPAKDAANVAKHGLSLAEAESLVWETAMTWLDTRRNYGELRMSGIGYIQHRLHFVAFVDRDGERRIISLRKASNKEEKLYAKT